MEKVKLTREQANAIEYALQEVDEYKGNLDRLLRHASMNNVNFRNELHLLDTIDIVTLAKALYIGYEVEPEFKVGDWVVNISNGYIKLIENEREANFLNNDYIKRHELRHATSEEIAEEKERRWWAKHGREVWELKVGDFLINEKLGTIEEVKEIKWQKYLIGKWTAYMELDYIKDNYSVAFFVEDRKDI